MYAKAATWSQVCKQLSGISGFIEVSEGVKVRPLEIMQSLGVHVTKNHYSPKDIFTAWSARLKDEFGVVRIAKNVPYHIDVLGASYRLHTQLDNGEYKGVSRLELCNLVSMDAVKDDSTDTVVTAQNVLRGLQQSVFVDDTLERVAKSYATCEGMNEGWINVADKKDAPKWERVCKVNGNWILAVDVKAKKAA